MRVIGLLAAIALLSTSDGVAQFNTPDQIKPSGLLVGHRVDEYFGESYTSRPRDGFLFFRGEPITYRVNVLNMGSAESALVVTSTDLERLFAVEAYKAPLIPAEKFNLLRPFSNGRYLDEIDVEVPLRVSPPTKTWAGGAFSIPMEPEIRLNPKEGI